jgi:hypothetical protein
MDNNTPTSLSYQDDLSQHNLKKKTCGRNKENAINKTTPARVTLHTHPRLAT